MAAIEVSADTWQRLANLGSRLGLAPEAALAALAGRTDLMVQVAAALTQPPAPGAPQPLRLRPEHPVCQDLARIAIGGSVITTWLPQADERFVAVVKRLHYRWHPDALRWARTIDKFAEPLADRSVELGVHLLAAGFSVEVPSEELRQRIATGDYRPEQRNWVMARIAGKYTGWLLIRWDRDGEDYYRRAARITGARCYPGSALVPAAHCDEVEDFAHLYGFPLSDGALDLIRRARAERAAILLAAPPVRRAPAAVVALPNLDPPIGGIADELADEPL